MAGSRARLAVAHALAWTGFGTALELAAQAVVPASSLALGAAVVVAVGALALVVPVRAAPARQAAVAVVVALGWAVSLAVSALVSVEPERLALLSIVVAPMAMHVRATLAAIDEAPALAPAVRIAPTLLALAAGAALVAASDALGLPLLVPLALLAALLAAAAALLLTTPVDAHRAEPPRPAPLGRTWALLAIGAAGAVAVVALRPALSALGEVEPQPAGPSALALALGALLGPPLARLAERLPASVAVPTLATVAGAAALAAPVARPGLADLLAAAVLGLGVAALVALAEVARRAGLRLSPGQLALLALAGAAGAGVAALLLTAVPLTDVVLGAAIACLVAGLGAWAPGSRERVAA